MDNGGSEFDDVSPTSDGSAINNSDSMKRFSFKHANSGISACTTTADDISDGDDSSCDGDLSFFVSPTTEYEVPLSDGPKATDRPLLKIPSFKRKISSPRVETIGVMGGGVGGVTISAILSNISEESADVIFEIYIFERLGEILQGTSQIASVLHAGAGEYWDDAVTIADCQKHGEFYKTMMFPPMYVDNTQPVTFASDLAFKVSPSARKRARKKAKEINRECMTPERLNSDSQPDISPEVMQRVFPNLTNAVLSENDIYSKNAERDANLKKFIRGSQHIKVITNYTVHKIIKNDDGSFAIMGHSGQQELTKFEREFDHVILTLWDQTENVLNASFPGRSAYAIGHPPVINEDQSAAVDCDDVLNGTKLDTDEHDMDNHVVFDSVSGELLASDECMQNTFILPELSVDDRVMALFDITSLPKAKRGGIMMRPDGGMFLPRNERMAIGYRCLAGASYPVAGEQTISSENVLEHGRLIRDELKKIFKFKDNELIYAGAIKKVIVRRAGEPLHKRAYNPPIITPEGVIVSIPLKATFASTAAVDAIKLLLQRMSSTCEKFSEKWIREIQKIEPKSSCLSKENRLSDVFTIRANESVNEADIMYEDLAFIKSFELTFQGHELLKSYEEEYREALLRIQRPNSVNMHFSDAPKSCRHAKIMRAVSDPYWVPNCHQHASLIELSVFPHTSSRMNFDAMNGKEEDRKKEGI